MRSAGNEPEHEPPADRPAVLAWRTYPEAVLLIVRGATARAGLKVALLVGTLLTAVNEGASIVGGHATAATWARLAVNYVVPYVVASAGYLTAFRVRDDDRPAR
ncbi:MAG: nitrate/nitrite transporter NrtS [Thermoplasmata archaeon]|nr:nitrate/nitrite transporter NrtS [Thermoplasmata archaeon]